MTNERKVSLVIGDEPAHHHTPAEARRAGLTATLASVIATYRSDSPDMVLDHRLWLACARAVTEVVRADEVEVFGEPTGGFLQRLFGARRTADLGDLDAYAALLAKDDDAPEWGSVQWRRQGQLVATAVAEYFYRIGGPEPYHDSYTMRVFMTPPTVADLLGRMQLRIEEEGGFVDGLKTGRTGKTGKTGKT